MDDGFHFPSIESLNFYDFQIFNALIGHKASGLVPRSLSSLLSFLLSDFQTTLVLENTSWVISKDEKQSSIEVLQVIPLVQPDNSSSPAR